MEETKSSYEGKEAQDQRGLDRSAQTPLQETYIDGNGMTQRRYSIHDLGQKRGRKLGFCIVDNYRFAMVNHPPLETRQAATWYLMEMKPDHQDSTAPGPVGGILKGSPSNVEKDTKSSTELVPTASSENTRLDDIQEVRVAGRDDKSAPWQATTRADVA
jgi:hypothetical protein